MRHSPPAYSLIFAFLIMTVIMIIASTTVENTTEKLAYFREMEGGTEALLAAESATEQAILAMKDFNAGYSIGLESDAFQVDEDGDGTYETWADYTVYSTAQLNSTDIEGYYYTPIPGTGSAASEDDCTVSDSDHDGDFDDDELVDHPCNWNKLLYGDSVTIPLYASDGTETGILSPSALGFNGFYLKVRTPCADTLGQPDEADCSARYTMNETDSTGTFDSGGDSVIFWQLTGESDSDGDGVGDTPVSVLPDDTPYEDFFSPGVVVRYPSVNTEVYESKINDASDYTVLEVTGSSSGTYADIYDVCIDSSLTDLSLQLDIVTPLTDDTGASIPYLEWQLAIDSTDPFADTKAVIVGEGYHQGQSGIFYYPFVVTRSTTGESTSVYTLSN